MTQYLLSVWTGDNDAMPGFTDLPPMVDIEQIMADVDVLNSKIKADGQWVFGGGLAPVSSATVVRNTGGPVITTDGPFAESKEALGGFWILELADLDVALELAAACSAACRAPVEVRPFHCDPLDDVPADHA